MKKQRGGRREGSGRKKIKDKKVQISVYPRLSSVRKVGGKKAAKEVALEAIENV